MSNAVVVSLLRSFTRLTPAGRGRARRGIRALSSTTRRSTSPPCSTTPRPATLTQPKMTLIGLGLKQAHIVRGWKRGCFCRRGGTESLVVLKSSYMPPNLLSFHFTHCDCFDTLSWHRSKSVAEWRVRRVSHSIIQWGTFAWGRTDEAERLYHKTSGPLLSSSSSSSHSIPLRLLSPTPLSHSLSSVFYS